MTTPPKIRGYHYQIVEMYPFEDGHAIRELHTYDNLEDAEKVMEVLESVNMNFTCYAIILRPVWEVTNIKLEKPTKGWEFF